MTLRPCKCGATPTIDEREQSGIQIVQVKCKCGKQGACLMYTKREHREKMLQAAADGWNLADA